MYFSCSDFFAKGAILRAAFISSNPQFLLKGILVTFLFFIFQSVVLNEMNIKLPFSSLIQFNFLNSIKYFLAVFSQQPIIPDILDAVLPCTAELTNFSLIRNRMDNAVILELLLLQFSTNSVLTNICIMRKPDSTHILIGSSGKVRVAAARQP